VQLEWAQQAHASFMSPNLSGNSIDDLPVRLCTQQAAQLEQRSRVDDQVECCVKGITTRWFTGPTAGRLHEVRPDHRTAAPAAIARLRRVSTTLAVSWCFHTPDSFEARACEDYLAISLSPASFAALAHRHRVKPTNGAPSAQNGDRALDACHRPGTRSCKCCSFKFTQCF
jgi:hypothetical protein